MTKSCKNCRFWKLDRTACQEKFSNKKINGHAYLGSLDGWCGGMLTNAGDGCFRFEAKQ